MLDDWNAQIISEYDNGDPSTVSQKEREILRELSKILGSLAKDPINNKKKQLWIKHNSLNQERIMIACDPENSWNEIISQESLKCESAIGRFWEFLLKREIYWGENMNDDHVLEGTFDIPFIYKNSGWGLELKKVYSKEKNGSYTWEAPLKDYRDISKLRFPQIELDLKKTELYSELAHEIMGENLKIKRRGTWWWTLGMTMNVAFFRGLEDMMFDFYDNPDEMHMLMGFLCDGYNQMLDFLEENNLLTSNNDGSNCGSGGYGFTEDLPVGENLRVVKIANMWGFFESQETVSVSPEMFEEFIFPYQKKLSDRFGLLSYGCCEGLERRFHIIRNFKNLRRIAVSPFANLEQMSEQIQRDYIFSHKLSPVPLSRGFSIDKKQVRAEIRKALDITLKNNAEFKMQDTHTLGGNSENPKIWCDMVREEMGDTSPWRCRR